MKTTLALAALCLVMFAVSVYADGMIIPEPIPPHPHPELMEVRYHNVDVTIDNQYTETKIDQVFHNPNSWDIEGTYLFPLPEGASIQKFSMFVNGEELTGEVLDAGEARQIYEDLVRKMIDPGLLEYVDRNTFKARVYPIEKNSDKKVNLEYSEVISCEGGICEYLYPLNTEKFSSKNLESVVIKVKIKSNVPIKSIYSPSHEIDVDRISDYEADVSYEARNVKPDTDFKLIYTVSNEDISANLITHKEGDEGYFLLMLAPKFAVDASKIINKDVVFVLDKSGSMAGDKIEQAKDALKFSLNNLNSGDRFGIVTFSTGVNSYKENLEGVTSSSINEALDFVDGIKALGGTDIQGALLAALEMMPSGNTPKMIIFLTDGEPTVGVTDISQILKDVADENSADAKIFVFGVGYDVNTRLLDKLSIDNHGASEYVVEDENIEVKVSNFYEKIDSPVMSDVEVAINGRCAALTTDELYPKELPDIFKGTQLLVFGQYRYLVGGNCGSDWQTATITLKGRINGVESSVTYRVDFPDSNLDNDFLPRLWATRKIGYLLDEIRLNGEDDEMVDEIIDLSKKYGIATPYTSFLILEDEPTQAVREGLNRAFAPSTGADAVGASQSLNAAKSAEYMGAASQNFSGPGGQTTTIKYVGSKTFIEKNGYLTDTAYVEGSATKNLKYGSDAYFQAIADNPELGQYLAIGKSVIVCVGGECIKVGESYSGTESNIGALNFGAQTTAMKMPAQCAFDSDCVVNPCGCTCVPSTSAICTLYKDCAADAGVLGCECDYGVCRPVIDDNWEPDEPPMPPNPPPLPDDEVCGNGICESGESYTICPEDCKKKTTDQTGTIAMILGLVSVLIVLVIVVKFILPQRNKGDKKIKKTKAETKENKAEDKAIENKDK